MCARVLDEAMSHQVMNERVLDESRWSCVRFGWLQRVVKSDAHVLHTLCRLDSNVACVEADALMRETPLLLCETLLSICCVIITLMWYNGR